MQMHKCNRDDVASSNHAGLDIYMCVYIYVYVRIYSKRKWENETKVAGGEYESRLSEATKKERLVLTYTYNVIIVVVSPRSSTIMKTATG